MPSYTRNILQIEYKDNLSIRGKPSDNQESEKPCPLDAKLQI